MLALSLIELPNIMVLMEFWARGVPWTLYANRVVRNSRNIACIYLAHTLASVFHQTSLTKHKFKKNYNEVNDSDSRTLNQVRALLPVGPRMTSHVTWPWSGIREASVIPIYHLGSLEKSHYCTAFASELADPSS